MNCREYIIEFEERGTLSEPATLHLTICADCRKISERQTRIWLMIDGLKPVAAPSDFNFHVKAKIADAKPTDFQSPRFLPVLRYVLPLSVVVLLFGFIIYNSLNFSAANPASIAQKNSVSPGDNASVNQVAFNPSDKVKIDVEPATDEKTISATNPDIPKTDLKKPLEIAGLTNKRLNKSPKANAENNSGGGSRVGAFTKSRVILPPGISSESNSVNGVKVELPKQVGDEQLLSFLGIETVLENGKLTVKVLTKDKTGERSGVKVGDIVEKVKGDSLTVMRGTEKLEITLQNNVVQPR